MVAERLKPEVEKPGEPSVLTVDQTTESTPRTPVVLGLL